MKEETEVTSLKMTTATKLGVIGDDQEPPVNIPHMITEETQDSTIAVLDTACTRCVLGEPWFMQWERNGGHVMAEQKCQEGFLFGDGKPSMASRRILIEAVTQGRPWRVWAFIVQDNIPLLLSRGAQRELGIHIHHGTDSADIDALGLQGVHLKDSVGGHPSVTISDQDRNGPDI